jgi:hypothetical protein
MRRMKMIKPKIISITQSNKVSDTALALHKITIERQGIEIRRLLNKIERLERDRDVVVKATEYYQKLSSKKRWWKL